MRNLPTPNFPTSPHPTPRLEMSCKHAAELLPWLMNGTLEDQERQSVLGHLSTCDDCRVELGETVQVWEMFDEHVPSLALAEYAEGLEPSGSVSRQEIETHLAHCPSCREELDLATSNRVVEIGAWTERASRPTRRRGSVRRQLRTWRGLAVAASLVAMLSAVELVRTRSNATATIPETATASASVEGDDSQTAANVHEASVLFFDGFESGTMTSWSSSSQ